MLEIPPSDAARSEREMRVIRTTYHGDRCGYCGNRQRYATHEIPSAIDDCVWCWLQEFEDGRHKRAPRKRGRPRLDYAAKLPLLREFAYRDGWSKSGHAFGAGVFPEIAKHCGISVGKVREFLAYAQSQHVGVEIGDRVTRQATVFDIPKSLKDADAAYRASLEYLNSTPADEPQYLNTARALTEGTERTESAQASLTLTQERSQCSSLTLRAPRDDEEISICTFTESERSQSELVSSSNADERARPVVYVYVQDDGYDNLLVTPRDSAEGELYRADCEQQHIIPETRLMLEHAEPEPLVMPPFVPKGRGCNGDDGCVGMRSMMDQTGLTARGRELQQAGKLDAYMRDSAVPHVETAQDRVAAVAAQAARAAMPGGALDMMAQMAADRERRQREAA